MSISIHSVSGVVEMKLERVLKGVKVSFPVSFFGKGSGFTSAESPEDGLRIKMNPDEYELLFIPDSELKKLGYYYRNPPKPRAKKEVKKAHAKRKTKKRG